MQKIRFGVVGTNFITDWVIAGGREDERFELVAVCSRSEETAKAFAEKHNIPHTFTSLEEMAASPLGKNGLCSVFSINTKCTQILFHIKSIILLFLIFSITRWNY